MEKLDKCRGEKFMAGKLILKRSSVNDSGTGSVTKISILLYTDWLRHLQAGKPVMRDK